MGDFELGGQQNRFAAGPGRPGQQERGGAGAGPGHRCQVSETGSKERLVHGKAAVEDVVRGRGRVLAAGELPVREQL